MTGQESKDLDKEYFELLYCNDIVKAAERAMDELEHTSEAAVLKRRDEDAFDGFMAHAWHAIFSFGYETLSITIDSIKYYDEEPASPSSDEAETALAPTRYCVIAYRLDGDDGDWAKGRVLVDKSMDANEHEALRDLKRMMRGTHPGSRIELEGMGSFETVEEANAFAAKYERTI